MNIFTTTWRGSEISVIFTGSHYYFLNSYYGILAIAERDYDRTEYVANRSTFFTLTTGNHHTEGGSLGGSVVRTLAQRFINRAESKYMPVSVSYDFQVADLANGHIDCNYIQR